MEKQPYPATPNLETARFLERLQTVALGGQYLYLLHLADGKILKILNEDGSNFTLVAREFREGGSLAKFYDMTPLLSGATSLSAAQKVRFKWHLQPVEVDTHLPITTLSSQCLEPGLFLGRVAFESFIPNIVSHAIYTFIFVDIEKETLLGFHSTFHQFFRSAYSAPEKMLHLPLSAFLTPTPLDIEKRYLSPFSLKSLEAFKTLFEKDFTGEGGASLEEAPANLRLSLSEEGLLWDGDALGGDRQGYLTIPDDLNFYQTDFAATLVFAPLAGTGPLFILGDRFQEEDVLPDNTGYLAGRNSTGERLVFKKVGFNSATALAPALKPGEEVRLTFCKIGRSLFLFENGVQRLAFWDGSFLHKTAGHLSLSLRPGSRCLLRRLTLQIKKTSPGEAVSSAKTQIVKVLTPEPRYHTFDRFYNNSLNQENMSNVAGYFLHDITELQERISSLDQKYRSQVRRERLLQTRLEQYESKTESLVGSGPKIQLIKETAKIIAHATATVLIEGPTGSGKEMLARYVHDNGVFKEGPFIKVDCATVPRELIESHLFGHEKGAFTGAVNQVIGMFERADGGTLFLDEVGNLTLEVQAKLLQFFNDFAITRIGGSTPIPLKLRCIAASNLNLQTLVRDGAFREDLYFRINVVNIALPPLRERIEDIPALSTHFLNQCKIENQKPDILGFSSGAAQKLLTHGWPGNIRELKNVVQRAVIFCGGKEITEDLIAFDREKEHSPRRQEMPAFRISLTDKKVVAALLEKHHGRVIKVARELGVSRAALYNYFTREKINPKNFRRGFGA